MARLSRTTRPSEEREHALRRESARSYAHRSGFILQAAKGKSLDPFMPPTFNEMADRHNQLRLAEKGDR